MSRNDVPRTSVARTRRWISCAFVWMLWLASCQWSEDRYAKRNVQASEIHGTWVATDYAIKSLADVGVKDHLNREDHVLVLRPDGSCSVRTTFDLPPPENVPSSYHVYADGCTWTLVPAETRGRRRQELRLALTRPDRHISFSFADEEGQVIIWQYATDPDAWRYLEFAKSRPAA